MRFHENFLIEINLEKNQKYCKKNQVNHCNNPQDPLFFFFILKSFFLIAIFNI